MTPTKMAKDNASPGEMTRLLEIMARLRDPVDGCPWDQLQTNRTIAPYTIEEAYEVAEAIAERRGNLDDYALVSTGSTSSLSSAAAKARLESFADTGANWWLEWITDEPGTYSETVERIKRGPPSS